MIKNMKKIMKFWIVVCMSLPGCVLAQKYDEERMRRDIEVAENVLSTLIKQEVSNEHKLFGIDIKGTYLPGYGVTFRLPGDFMAPYMLTIPGDNAVIYGSKHEEGFSYTITTDDTEDHRNSEPEARAHEMQLKDKTRVKRRADLDSAKSAYNQKLIKASKDFIVDYGDFISQLGPNERIVITNQGEHNMGWYFNSGKRTHMSIEGSKADIIAFKQGKITRDQVMAKLTVVNTESIETKEPDMELLSSIFNRLYRTDLSNTFFTEDNIYYERLKDYGAVFYMQVYSSNQADHQRFNMPTVGLEDVSQEVRDKKVAELYPKFEQDMKDNILEYGRTLKSLKDDEVLVFNITLTKCKSCNIPSTLELSVKTGVLKDFGAGKIDKATGLTRIVVKKGANQ
jgi:hypothetical protein